MDGLTKGEKMRNRKTERQKYLCTIVGAIVLLCELNRIHGRSPLSGGQSKNTFFDFQKGKRTLDEMSNKKLYLLFVC